MRGPRALRWAVLALSLAWTTPIDDLGAQSVRVSGSSGLQYIEVRPFMRDSVAAGEVGGSGLLRQTADGHIVRCVTGDAFCRGTRPAGKVSTIPAVQDLEVSAWGLGEGIQAFAHLRGRTAWGGNPDLWPRANETLDVLAAYGEFSRERYRIRAGRQWTTSGLGFYNFDGVSALVRPIPGLVVEGGAGRSLVRGLNEPRTGSALEAIEELAPNEPGLMLTGQVRYRPSQRLSLAALYHRDVRDDRAGLYAELARAEGLMRFGDGSIEASMERDLAGGQFNEARLRLRAPPFRATSIAAEVRRYRPYFELWTIWGAFSPVGFDEGRLDLTWARPTGDLIVRGEATYRNYDDTGMETSPGSLRTNGWGLGASASWSPRDHWRVDGGYRMEVGFGAARSEGHVGVLRRIGPDSHVAVRGLAFQRLYEFRLDHGVVVGMGAEGAHRITDRSRIVGSLTAYRHLDQGDTSGMDWTQLRGSLRVRWTVGAEPGVPTGPEGVR
ncbi:MAG: hypothetical protein WD960_09985 [Gemmatimonadota bacterium]